ncbi:hypothetical protein M9Y10_001589 [Tritrichomonas musculus]|uniref:Surface antigen BspA-like n=1 Tax=Tritrichomonas musculus TaxID=1915356 RepID=A0ABR2L7F8_9EUKA
MIGPLYLFILTILSSCSTKKALVDDWCAKIANYAVNAENVNDQDHQFSDKECRKTSVTFSGVTSIGNGFFQSSKLNSVTITTAITRIESYAFYDAEIATVNLASGSNTQFGNSIFADSQITNLQISMATIPNYLFGSNGYFSNVVFTNAVETVEDYAFSGSTINRLNMEAATLITEVQSTYGATISEFTSIPPNLKIVSSAFAGKTVPSQLVFNDQLQTISTGAFQGCTSLKSVDFSKATYLKTIGSNAFKETSLKTVKFPSNGVLEEIQSGAFQNLITLEGTDNTVIKAHFIRSSAFANCINLVASIEITSIPSSSSTIGPALIDSSAFLDCYKINNLNIEKFEYSSSIGASAFRNSGIQVISLPEVSFKSIGRNAFLNCSRFTGAPNSKLLVDSIAEFAFQFDDQFNVAEIKAEQIAQQAFEYCKALSAEITLEEKGNIGGQAFAYCGPLKGLKLNRQENDDSETYLKTELVRQSIGNNAFYRSGLTGDLQIPLTVNFIGQGAFAYCNLNSINISGSNKFAQFISQEAFYRSVPKSKNFELNIPFSVVNIGPSAFAYCPIETLTIYGSKITDQDQYGSSQSFDKTNIQEKAFYSCDQLKTLVFEGFDIDFDKTSFKGCPIKDITFGNIKKIPDEAFYGMTSIEGDIIIPDSVSEIGDYAFQGCSGITGVTFENRTKFIFTLTGDTGSLPNLDPLHISDKEIGKFAFYGCTGIKKITIPHGVKIIEEYTYYRCSQLESIEIPKTVTQINQYAFYQCTGLNCELELPDELTQIDGHAFEGCNKLKGSLIIPDLVLSIGPNAFMGCTTFNELKLGRSLYIISSNAFRDCTSFRGSLVLPKPSLYNNGNNVEFRKLQIQSNAFSRCSQFSGLLEIPENTEVLGIGAFRDCYSLTGLRLPDSITSLNNYVFSGCYGFTGPIPTGNLQYIGVNAFANCSGFTGDLDLSKLQSSGDLTISDYAFYNCQGLNGQLLLPSSVVNVNKYAFYGCSGLQGTLDCSSLEKVERSAFEKCSSLSGPLIFKSAEEIQENAFAGCSGFSDTLSFVVGGLSIDQGAFRDCSGFNKGTLRFMMAGYEENAGNQLINVHYTFQYFLKIDNEAFENTKFDNVYYLGRFAPDCGYDSGISKAKNIYTSSNYANKTFCGKTVKGKGGLSGGAIAGIVIAVVVVVAIIVILVIFFLKKKGKDNSEGEVEMNNEP